MCDEPGVSSLVAALSSRLAAGTDHAETTGEQAADQLLGLAKLKRLIEGESNELVRVVQRTGHWRVDGSRSDGLVVAVVTGGSW